MSRGNPGVVVETKTGKIGIVYRKEAYVNGKAAVYVVESLLNPKAVIKDGKQEKILCDPATLKIRGYCD